MDHKRFQLIMAVVIGIAVGVSTFIHLQRSDFHLQRSECTEEKLIKASKHMNARLPLDVTASAHSWVA